MTRGRIREEEVVGRHGFELFLQNIYKKKEL